MKKGVGKYVMIVLASLLILSFAVWGVGDMVGVISNPDEVATVGDTKITQRQFQKRYRQQLNEIRSRIGNIDSEQAQKLGLAPQNADTPLLSQKGLIRRVRAI